VETSALGIWSARVGRNGPALCAGGVMYVI
jgi:hypothetical protein